MKTKSRGFFLKRSDQNNPDCDAVVIVGASLMNSVYGRDLLTPNAAATQRLSELLGRPMPVYGYATPSSVLSAGVTYYQEARAAFPNAMIIMHSGGNNVTNTRPYSGLSSAQINGLQADFQNLVNIAYGDKRLYPMSLSFRSYGNPSSDKRVFIDPSLGSKPYNENIFIPAYRNYWEHAVDRMSGRPLFDFYRFVLSDYENMLESDGVHLTSGVSGGRAKVREWMMRRVADIITGRLIAEIPEQTYDPTAVPVIPISRDLTPSIFNFWSSQFADPQGSQCGIDVNKSGGINGEAVRLVNTDGQDTPVIATLNFTGNPTQQNIAHPGYGYNDVGRTSGIAFANNLLSDPITNGSLFIVGAAVSLVINFTGCVPGATYSLGVVSSRNTTDTRASRFTFGGNSVTIVSREDPVVARTLTGVADANGTLSLLFEIAAGSYGHLNGFSLVRQP